MSETNGKGLPKRQGCFADLIPGEVDQQADLALQVLAANGVRVLADSADGFVPTPALSHAIIRYNRAGHDDSAAAAPAAASRVTTTDRTNLPAIFAVRSS